MYLGYLCIDRKVELTCSRFDASSFKIWIDQNLPGQNWCDSTRGTTWWHSSGTTWTHHRSLIHHGRWPLCRQGTRCLWVGSHLWVSPELMRTVHPIGREVIGPIWMISRERGPSPGTSHVHLIGYPRMRADVGVHRRPTTWTAKVRLWRNCIISHVVEWRAHHGRSLGIIWERRTSKVSWLPHVGTKIGPHSHLRSVHHLRRTTRGGHTIVHHGTGTRMVVEIGVSVVHWVEVLVWIELIRSSESTASMESTSPAEWWAATTASSSSLEPSYLLWMSIVELIVALLLLLLLGQFSFTGCLWIVSLARLIV